MEGQKKKKKKSKIIEKYPLVAIVCKILTRGLVGVVPTL